MGASQTLLTSASSQVATAKIAMMRTNIQAPSPLARMAVTSLSAANRLRPIRIPTSRPMGIVIVNATGRVRKKISATLGNGALLRTTISSSRPKVPHENNKGEQGNADGGVLHNFAKDVAGKNLHGATGPDTFIET